MKRLINSFSKNQLSAQEATNVKGGTMGFCEWYVSYAGSNNINPTTMATAMGLDQIANKWGMEVALIEGGSDFLASFTSNGGNSSGSN